jgi:O-antigen/teichoic acid export membrane protein
MFLKGIFWDLIEKVFNQGIGFIISIILARILTPEDFGLVGMTMVVVSFSQVFMDMGFSTALIQKQEITEEQFSTVFYLNILLGAFLTLLMFICSGVIADFYNQPAISSLMKGISFLFIINSLSIVQTTQFLKAIDLKPLTIFRGLAVIISGCIGISMAYTGYGVWSLVAQSILNALIYTVLIWIKSSWRPRTYFDLHAISDLWRYGAKIFMPNLIESIFSRLDVLIIGKIFSPSTLGFYTRAQSLNNLVVQYTSGSLMKVFFPAISRYQQDTTKVTEIYKMTLVVVSFAALGLLSVLFVCAEDIIILLFTIKWIKSVEYFRMLTLGGFAYPLSSLMVNIISARGKSGDYFKLDLIKKTILSFIFIIGFQNGISTFLIGLVIFSFIGVIINMYFVSREINLSLLIQIKAIAPYFLIAIISAFVGMNLKIDGLMLPRMLSFIIEASIVVGIYIILNVLVKSKALIILKEKIFAERNFFLKRIQNESYSVSSI